MNNSFKIVVSGGKGGVGKSMLASSLALLFHREKEVVAVDADVDVPNLALWLNEVGEWDQIEKISTSERPVIGSQQGNLEKCVAECRFNALEIEKGKLKVNPFLCEGCGACRYFCSSISRMKSVKNGQLKFKTTKYGFPLLVGELEIGETGSGKIVTQLKTKADELDKDLQIIDSAPGIGCPVTAAVRDADFVILVTEPTPAGLSNLKRIEDLVKYFNVETGVIINKWKEKNETSERIKTWAGDKFIDKIDYDQGVIKSVSQLIPIMKTDLETKKQVEEIFVKIKSKIQL